ncbi:hypothetical protein OPIT5_00225 (plasmid) [Opitutaceae bacterium TAV5]|nr:hypothetical protein OPIT5_00225 [Opitutaceae bacterium TAV5]
MTHECPKNICIPHSLNVRVRLNLCYPAQAIFNWIFDRDNTFFVYIQILDRCNQCCTLSVPRWTTVQNQTFRLAYAFLVKSSVILQHPQFRQIADLGVLIEKSNHNTFPIDRRD